MTFATQQIKNVQETELHDENVSATHRKPRKAQDYIGGLPNHLDAYAESQPITLLGSRLVNLETSPSITLLDTTPGKFAAPMYKPDKKDRSATLAPVLPAAI